jgi:hypothetical protein
VKGDGLLLDTLTGTCGMRGKHGYLTQNAAESSPLTMFFQGLSVTRMRGSNTRLMCIFINNFKSNPLHNCFQVRKASTGSERLNDVSTLQVQVGVGAKTQVPDPSCYHIVITIEMFLLSWAGPSLQ